MVNTPFIHTRYSAFPLLCALPSYSGAPCQLHHTCLHDSQLKFFFLALIEGPEPLSAAQMLCSIAVQMMHCTYSRGSSATDRLHFEHFNCPSPVPGPVPPDTPENDISLGTGRSCYFVQKSNLLFGPKRNCFLQQNVLSKVIIPKLKRPGYRRSHDERLVTRGAAAREVQKCGSSPNGCQSRLPEWRPHGIVSSRHSFRETNMELYQSEVFLTLYRLDLYTLTRCARSATYSLKCCEINQTVSNTDTFSLLALY